MPMLPDVESSRTLSGVSCPLSTAERMILSAGRSLTEPLGLNHSALAYTFTAGGKCAVIWFSCSKGVLPTRSGTETAPERDRLWAAYFELICGSKAICDI